VVVAVAILVASVSRPAGGLGGLGPLGIVGVDKYLHALSFAALAMTLAVALPTVTTRRLLFVVVGVAVAYGLAIELLQLTLAYRSFSLLDLAADAVGAGVVALGWRLGQAYRQRHEPV
jgi:VanZ family protein